MEKFITESNLKTSLTFIKTKIDNKESIVDGSLYDTPLILTLYRTREQLEYGLFGIGGKYYNDIHYYTALKPNQVSGWTDNINFANLIRANFGKKSISYPVTLKYNGWIPGWYGPHETKFKPVSLVVTFSNYVYLKDTTEIGGCQVSISQNNQKNNDSEYNEIYNYDYTFDGFIFVNLKHSEGETGHRVDYSFTIHHLSADTLAPANDKTLGGIRLSPYSSESHLYLDDAAHLNVDVPSIVSSTSEKATYKIGNLKIGNAVYSLPKPDTFISNYSNPTLDKPTVHLVSGTNIVEWQTIPGADHYDICLHDLTTSPETTTDFIHLTETQLDLQNTSWWTIYKGKDISLEVIAISSNLDDVLHSDRAIYHFGILQIPALSTPELHYKNNTLVTSHVDNCKTYELYINGQGQQLDAEKLALNNYCILPKDMLSLYLIDDYYYDTVSFKIQALPADHDKFRDSEYSVTIDDIAKHNFLSISDLFYDNTTKCISLQPHVYINEWEFINNHVPFGWEAYGSADINLTSASLYIKICEDSQSDGITFTQDIDLTNELNTTITIDCKNTPIGDITPYFKANHSYTIYAQTYGFGDYLADIYRYDWEYDYEERDTIMGICFGWAPVVTVSVTMADTCAFANESWDTIAKNAKANNLANYNVGDIRKEGNFTYKIVDKQIGRYKLNSLEPSHLTIEIEPLHDTMDPWTWSAEPASFKNSNLITYLQNIEQELPVELQQVLPTATVYSGPCDQQCTADNKEDTNTKLFIPSVYELFDTDELASWASLDETASYDNSYNMGQLDYYKGAKSGDDIYSHTVDGSYKTYFLRSIRDNYGPYIVDDWGKLSDESNWNIDSTSQLLVYFAL